MLLAQACEAAPRAASNEIPKANASGGVVGGSSAARRQAVPLAAAPPAGTLASTYDFVEVTTGGASSADALPLVVALHGLGDRPESFIGLFEGLPAKARVVAPHSGTAHGGGYTWFPLSLGALDDAGPAIAARADSLAGFLRDLRTRRPTRGKPIVTGFSQGGALSFAIAARHPDAISLAVPIAGWLPPAAAPEPRGPHPTVVMAFHGSADVRVPVAHSRVAVDALGRLGLRAHLEVAEGVGHTIPGALRPRVLAEIARGCEAVTAQLP